MGVIDTFMSLIYAFQTAMTSITIWTAVICISLRASIALRPVFI